MTGRYEQTVLAPGGKLSRTTEAITGASDGQTVVVTIKPNGLSAAITASGTVQGSLLHLSGGGHKGRFDLSLSKSNETEYQRQVTELSKQGARQQAEKDEADQLRRLKLLTNEMVAYSATADANCQNSRRSKSAIGQLRNG